jgi:hypothetical protein
MVQTFIYREDLLVSLEMRTLQKMRTPLEEGTPGHTRHP